MAWDEEPPTDEELKVTATSRWDDEPPTDEELGLVGSVGAAEALARGAAQGATLGFADEIAGAYGAQLANADRFKGLGRISDPRERDAFVRRAREERGDAMDAYRAERDASRAAFAQAEQDQPGAYTGGMFGGALLTSFIPGANVAAGASLAQAARTGAALGGAAGLGGSSADLTQGEVGEAAFDTALGTGGGAAFGAATQAATQGAGRVYDYLRNKVSRGADKTLRGIGKTLANVNEDVTDEYLARGGQISARDMSEIVDDVRGRVGDARKVVEDGREALSRSQSLRADAALRAQRAEMEALEELKKRSLTQLSGDIDADLKRLRTQISQGSSDSYDILAAANTRVPTKPLAEALDEAINAQFVESPTGVPTLITEEAEATVKRLQNLKDRLQPLGPNVPAPTAKRIIQQYDRVTDYGSPGYDSAVNAAKKAARARLNEVIAQSLEESEPILAQRWKETMAQVSANRQLEDRLIKAGFGDESRRFQALRNLKSDSGRALRLPDLEELQKRVGSDYYDDIDRYFEAQNILQSPTAKADFLAALPENRALQQTDKIVTEADAALAQAKAAFDPLKRFDEGTQAKLQAVRGARSVDARRRLEDFDRVTGTNFTNEALDRTLLDAFEKADTQGSRKTVMGALAGRAIGAGLGGAAGGATTDSPYGAAGGAAAGFFADKYSGRILKALLDGRIATGNAVQALERSFGKYAVPLAQAAQRGSQSLAITQYLLSKHDPEFRKLQQGEDQGN